jgi:L-seryl-tRNA(Ser) seleniumtransferase
MRAFRVDKTCLMVLERTLHLFRDTARLRREHPTYSMVSTPLETLRARGAELLRRLAAAVPQAKAELGESSAYLGSGSLPTEALPSIEVKVSLPGLSADELSRRLRMDEACIFGRIADDLVRLDMRTVTDEQVPTLAEALARVATGGKQP